MTTGPDRCNDCGQDVFGVYLFDHGRLKIDLDLKPVVGGDYTYWNPTYGTGQHWRATYRPAKVSPPLNMSDQDAKQWDGEKAANERSWFVRHVCGLTAAQIVQERHRRKSA
ncbi:hypothetical protein [Nonomuraea sp. NPDC049625]|uniref:hypothetical protein n=1 Tax=Nonomuraea sp. NPDC049625 TaxID=3155775 RepID=UPI003433B34B